MTHTTFQAFHTDDKASKLVVTHSSGKTTIMTFLIDAADLSYMYVGINQLVEEGNNNIAALYEHEMPGKHFRARRDQQRKK